MLVVPVTAQNNITIPDGRKVGSECVNFSVTVSE